MLDNTSLERLANDKLSNLLVLFKSYEEKEVLLLLQGAISYKLCIGPKSYPWQTFPA